MAEFDLSFFTHNTHLTQLLFVFPLFSPLKRDKNYIAKRFKSGFTVREIFWVLNT